MNVSSLIVCFKCLPFECLFKKSVRYIHSVICLTHSWAVVLSESIFFLLAVFKICLTSICMVCVSHWMSCKNRKIMFTAEKKITERILPSFFFILQHKQTRVDHDIVMSMVMMKLFYLFPHTFAIPFFRFDIAFLSTLNKYCFVSSIFFLFSLVFFRLPFKRIIVRLRIQNAVFFFSKKRIKKTRTYRCQCLLFRCHAMCLDANIHLARKTIVHKSKHTHTHTMEIEWMRKR